MGQNYAETGATTQFYLLRYRLQRFMKNLLQQNFFHILNKGLQKSGNLQ